jgi:hypothetical protein
MSDEVKDLVAIDIERPAVSAGNVAYYRLPDDMHVFFMKCQDKHKIVGFEYDHKRTLGLILEPKSAVVEVMEGVQALRFDVDMDMGELHDLIKDSVGE